MTGNSVFLEKRVAELTTHNRTLDSRILELYTLYNISKRLSVAIQMEEIFDGTMDMISHSLQIDDFCIFLIDEADKRLKVYAAHSDTDLGDIEFSPGEGVTGSVAERGETLLIQDVSKEPNFLFYKGKKKNIGSLICIPLKGRGGNILGTLNVHKQMKSGFSDEDQDLFAEVADQISAAVDKALSFRKMKDLSVTDELTGLYNRRYFFDYFEREMARAKRYEHPISIVIIDVDNFKNFNDVNGHLTGDEALKSVAKTLEDVLRKPDTLARLGGEEFIIALAETDKESAIVAVEKLRKAIEETAIKGEESQPGGRLTATFGVSSYPEDVEFATELIDCADRALYIGKARGRNLVVPYSSDPA